MSINNATSRRLAMRWVTSGLIVMLPVSILEFRGWHTVSGLLPLLLTLLMTCFPTAFPLIVIWCVFRSIGIVLLDLFTTGWEESLELWYLFDTAPGTAETVIGWICVGLNSLAWILMSIGAAQSHSCSPSICKIPKERNNKPLKSSAGPPTSSVRAPQPVYVSPQATQRPPTIHPYYHAYPAQPPTGYTVGQQQPAYAYPVPAGYAAVPRPPVQGQPPHAQAPPPAQAFDGGAINAPHNAAATAGAATGGVAIAAGAQMGPPMVAFAAYPPAGAPFYTPVVVSPVIGPAIPPPTPPFMLGGADRPAGQAYVGPVNDVRPPQV